MGLTLYKVDASPPARSVLMTIEALDLQDVEYVDINLLEGEHLKEEYIKMNPLHTVPTLKDDDFIVYDSHAINGYLVNQYAENDDLYPQDPKARALVDQRLHFNSGILFPTMAENVQPVIFKGEKAYKSLDRVTNAYELIEKLLTSTWLAGDNLTIADICCVATISSLNEVLPIDEDLYPNLVAWFNRCAEQEFYKNGNKGIAMFRRILQKNLGEN